MNTSDPQYNALLTTLQTWDKRWRIQKMLLWLPRLILIPLGLGVGLALLARFSPIFAPQDILIATGLSLLAFLGGFLGWFFIRQRDPLVSARYFDVKFGLQERVSTALELIEGRIKGDADLVSAQIADAQATANALLYKRQLALVIRRLDWAIVAGVCVLLAILLVLPNPNTQTIVQAQAEQQQIDESADEVKDLIEDIANDSSLDSATREELLQALQISLDTLENPEVSTEEALATLSDVQSLLDQKAQEATDRSQAQQEALQRALEELRNAENQPESIDEALQNLEEQLAQQEQENNATSSENQSSEQQSTENQSQAEALRQAAEQLEQTNPDAAQSLQEAAEAIENNDLQTAQESLEQAQEQLSQSENQQQQAEQSAENLAQASEQMQQQQQEIAQQQQQGQEQQQAQNQQQGQNQEGGQQQEGQQNQSENPEGQNQGDSNQTGDAEGENEGEGNPSESESEQVTQSDNPSNSQQNQQAQGNSMNNNSPTDNQGGDNQADLSQDTSGLTINDVERPEGEIDEVRGEAQYEAIFAPQRMGGQNGEDEIILAPDTNDENVREGDFSDNEAGNVTVPYNEVFNNYLGDANTALETGYIPLGLRDVIRQYFTSLAPTTSTQNDN
jgi:hypothetical protein